MEQLRFLQSGAEGCAAHGGDQGERAQQTVSAPSPASLAPLTTVRVLISLIYRRTRSGTLRRRGCRLQTERQSRQSRRPITPSVPSFSPQPISALYTLLQNKIMVHGEGQIRIGLRHKVICFLLPTTTPRLTLCVADLLLSKFGLGSKVFPEEDDPQTETLGLLEPTAIGRIRKLR